MHPSYPQTQFSFCIIFFPTCKFSEKNDLNGRLCGGYADQGGDVRYRSGSGLSDPEEFFRRFLKEEYEVSQLQAYSIR